MRLRIDACIKVNSRPCESHLGLTSARTQNNQAYTILITAGKHQPSEVFFFRNTLWDTACFPSFVFQVTEESFGEETAEGGMGGGGQLVTQPVGIWQTYWDSVGNRDYYYNTVRTSAAPPLVGRANASCGGETLTVAVRCWGGGGGCLPRAPSTPFPGRICSEPSDPFLV